MFYSKGNKNSRREADVSAPRMPKRAGQERSGRKTEMSLRCLRPIQRRGRLARRAEQKRRGLGGPEGAEGLCV